MSKKADASSQYNDLLKMLNAIPKIQEIDSHRTIYSKIYYLIYISRRFETKNFILSNYYNVSLTFLIEGYISLVRNLPNGSLLLLRPAIENFLKSIMETKNLYINERSYGENHTLLLEKLQDSSFIVKQKRGIVEELGRQYGKISGLSHSATRKNNFNIYQYFSDSIENENSIKDAELIWDKVLDSICLYATYRCSETYKKWEYWELADLLEIPFSKNKSRKLAEYFIDNFQEKP